MENEHENKQNVNLHFHKRLWTGIVWFYEENPEIMKISENKYMFS